MKKKTNIRKPFHVFLTLVFMSQQVGLGSLAYALEGSATTRMIDAKEKRGNQGDGNKDKGSAAHTVNYMQFGSGADVENALKSANEKVKEACGNDNVTAVTQSFKCKNGVAGAKKLQALTNQYNRYMENSLKTMFKDIPSELRAAIKKDCDDNFLSKSFTLPDTINCYEDALALKTTNSETLAGKLSKLNPPYDPKKPQKEFLNVRGFQNLLATFGAACEKAGGARSGKEACGAKSYLLALDSLKLPGYGKASGGQGGGDGGKGDGARGDGAKGDGVASSSATGNEGAGEKSGGGKKQDQVGQASNKPEDGYRYGENGAKGEAKKLQEHGTNKQESQAGGQKTSTETSLARGENVKVGASSEHQKNAVDGGVGKTGALKFLDGLTKKQMNLASLGCSDSIQDAVNDATCNPKTGDPLSGKTDIFKDLQQKVQEEGFDFSQYVTAFVQVQLEEDLRNLEELALRKGPQGRAIAKRMGNLLGSCGQNAHLFKYTDEKIRGIVKKVASQKMDSKDYWSDENYPKNVVAAAGDLRNLNNQITSIEAGFVGVKGGIKIQDSAKAYLRENLDEKTFDKLESAGSVARFATDLVGCSGVIDGALNLANNAMIFVDDVSKLGQIEADCVVNQMGVATANQYKHANYKDMKFTLECDYTASVNDCRQSCRKQGAGVILSASDTAALCMDTSLLPQKDREELASKGFKSFGFATDPKHEYSLDEYCKAKWAARGYRSTISSQKVGEFPELAQKGTGKNKEKPVFQTLKSGADGKAALDSMMNDVFNKSGLQARFSAACVSPKGFMDATMLDPGKMAHVMNCDESKSEACAYVKKNAGNLCGYVADLKGQDSNQAKWANMAGMSGGSTASAGLGALDVLGCAATFGFGVGLGAKALKTALTEFKATKNVLGAVRLGARTGYEVGKDAFVTNLKQVATPLGASMALGFTTFGVGSEAMAQEDLTKNFGDLAYDCVVNKGKGSSCQALGQMRQELKQLEEQSIKSPKGMGLLVAGLLTPGLGDMVSKSPAAMALKTARGKFANSSAKYIESYKNYTNAMDNLVTATQKATPVEGVSHTAKEIKALENSLSSAKRAMDAASDKFVSAAQKASKDFQDVAAKVARVELEQQGVSPSAARGKSGVVPETEESRIKRREAMEPFALTADGKDVIVKNAAGEVKKVSELTAPELLDVAHAQRNMPNYAPVADALGVKVLDSDSMGAVNFIKAELGKNTDGNPLFSSAAYQQSLKRINKGDLPEWAIEMKKDKKLKQSEQILMAAIDTVAQDKIKKGLLDAKKLAQIVKDAEEGSKKCSADCPCVN